MMVYTLLTQEGYIYYSYNSNEERFNYIFSLLANNLLLNQWNLIKEKHKNFKTTTFLEYIYNDKEIKNWLIKEALSLYDKETLHISFLCNGISYYIVPKEELRGYIEEFNLPNKVTSYISVLSKCKAFIESICLHNININTCKDAVEIFYKTKQKLLVKSQFDIDYNYMLAIQEISKKLSSIEKEVFYFIIYIEENFNNKITIDDGYKLIKKKYKDLSKEEYEKAKNDIAVLNAKKGELELQKQKRDDIQLKLNEVTLSVRKQTLQLSTIRDKLLSLENDLINTENDLKHALDSVSKMLCNIFK